MAAQTPSDDHIKSLGDIPFPVAILIRGLPGSGKSYLAAALEQAIGADKVVSVDPDAIDLNGEEYVAHTHLLTTEGVDPKLHLYRFLRAKAYEAITSHKVVIWNQPFSNLEIFAKMIARLEEHAAEQGTRVPVLVVEVGIDPALAKRRVEARKQAGGHGPSDNTFQRFVGEYGSAAAEGYRIVSVPGNSDVTVSVATVLHAVQQLVADQADPTT